MNLMTKLRQWLCQHESYLEELKRVSPEEVTSPCCKCGKVLSGPYGLALPCDWKRK